MGGFRPQLFYLLLQLTKVSQENLLFCPLFLFEESRDKLMRLPICENKRIKCKESRLRSANFFSVIVFLFVVGNNFKIEV